MQPSPPANFAEERWRSVENKLDKVLESLSELSGNYKTLNLRVTTLENAPKQALSRLMFYLSVGGCLYMLISAFIAVTGVIVSILLAAHH